MSKISAASLGIVSQSLALLRYRKDEIVARMEIVLRGASGENEPFGQSELAAATLVEMLLGQAQCLVEEGKFAPTDGVAADHRSLDLDGRHYSRFGDALIPVLADLLGPRLPDEVPVAWCDLFWAVVGRLKLQMAA